MVLKATVHKEVLNNHFLKSSRSSRTLELRIDGTPRLLNIPFFATLFNLIQHSPFINFGEICQPPLFIPDSPFINSCTQSTAVAWSLDKATKLFRCTCCFFRIAQNCFLITMKHGVAWRGESSKRTSDSSCR